MIAWIKRNKLFVGIIVLWLLGFTSLVATSYSDSRKNLAALKDSSFELAETNKRLDAVQENLNHYAESIQALRVEILELRAERHRLEAMPPSCATPVQGHLDCYKVCSPPADAGEH